MHLIKMESDSFQSQPCCYNAATGCESYPGVSPFYGGKELLQHGFWSNQSTGHVEDFSFEPIGLFFDSRFGSIASMYKQYDDEQRKQDDRVKSYDGLPRFERVEDSCKEEMCSENLRRGCLDLTSSSDCTGGKFCFFNLISTVTHPEKNLGRS